MWESVCMCVCICVQTIINDLWLHNHQQNKTKPSKQTKKEKYSQRRVVEPD